MLRLTIAFIIFHTLYSPQRLEGEVCGLQWQDYYNDYIILDRAADSKGKSTGTKTESSHRKIVLMQACKKAINLQKVEQEEIIEVIKSIIY